MKTNTPLKIRVSLACLRYTLSLYIMFVRQVVVKMTGNASYLLPVPTLTVITDGLDDLQAKADAAHGGGTIATAARDASWEASIMQVRELAGYVQANCQNDLATLLSSGFLANRTGGPVGPLDPPENLRIAYTSVSGHVILRFTRVAGVTAGYVIQQAVAVEGPYVTIATSTKTKVDVTGLTPATTYFFRVCANGTDGSSGWCNPVSVMAV